MFSSSLRCKGARSVLTVYSGTVVIHLIPNLVCKVITMHCLFFSICGHYDEKIQVETAGLEPELGVSPLHTFNWLVNFSFLVSVVKNLVFKIHSYDIWLENG